MNEEECSSNSLSFFSQAKPKSHVLPQTVTNVIAPTQNGFPPLSSSPFPSFSAISCSQLYFPKKGEEIKEQNPACKYVPTYTAGLVSFRRSRTRLFSSFPSFSFFLLGGGSRLENKVSLIVVVVVVVVCFSMPFLLPTFPS